MKRIPTLMVLLAALAGTLAAQGLPELFQKAKEQVKTASWTEALKTLDTLDSASARPGLEAQRKQLEPALAFYRAVSFANLDRPADAETQFKMYLAQNPNASLDRALYSKKVIDAMERARKAVAGPAEAGSALPSLAASYREFRIMNAIPVEAPREDWAAGPARVLLTSEEKRRWASLSDPVSRSEFVTKFWSSRDPKPETPENEFREEFERRVAFADRNFTQDETRGSLTDRGMVFLLLGPPTYAGRRPIGSGEDSSESAGMSSVGRHDAQLAIGDGTTSTGAKMSTGQKSVIEDRASGPGTQMPDSGVNWREVWHYRRELLPAGVPYQQVDFEFITRKGYGKNVLQRDSAVLASLDAARRKARP